MRNLVFVAALAVVASSLSAGEVYRWVDANGVVHYSDKPVSQDARPVELPELQTYPAGAAPTTLTAPARPVPQAPTSPYTEFKISSPAPDETIRGAERIVSINVSMTPPLTGGHQIVYYLDGTMSGGPTTATTFMLSGVDRGTHTIGAAVIGESGTEVARAGSVTVHVMPPIVRP